MCIRDRHSVHSCGAHGLANERPGLGRHAAGQHVQQQETTRTSLAGPWTVEPQRGLREPPHGRARRVGARMESG
eukprot:1202956-Pyramimonas_sp.AAC.1